MFSFRLLFAGVSAGLLLAASAPTQAQAPANDLCSSAQALVSGATVTGTTITAADDLLGLPGCQNPATSVHPDVWYTITATASQLDYIVSASTTRPTARFEVLVYEGVCGAGLSLLGFDCGAGVVSGGIGALTIGTTYRIVVASPDSAAAAGFTIQATTSIPPILPSQDCNRATILQNPATFSQGTINSGSGLLTNEVSPQNSCWGSGGERQSKWFKFIVGTTGKLQFNINPVDPQDDYDWAVWDVTNDPAGCTTKGNAIACNWTGARGSTGLSLCPNLEPGYMGGDQFDNTTTMQTGAAAPITVQAGRTYALLVDNFTTTNSGFTLLLGGACSTPPPGQTVAQIGVDALFDAFVECGAVVFSKRTPLAFPAGYTYLWNFGDGTSSTNPIALHVYQGSPNAPTTYTATLQLRTPLGYRLTNSFTVTIGQVPRARIVPAVPNPICAGDSLILRARGGATYQWSPAIGLSSTTDSVVRAAPLVNTTYKVVTRFGTCADSTTYQVLVTPLPTTRLTSVTQPIVCAGSFTELTATGAQRYEWSPAAGLSDTTGASVFATPAVTTTYTVRGYNGACMVADTVTVTVAPVPLAVVVPSTPLAICAGDSLTLIARGGASYQWSPATGLSSTTDSLVRAAPAVSTTYQIIVTTGRCSDTTTYRVEVTPLPTTQAVAALSDLCEGASTTLTATGADRYEWTPAPGLTVTGPAAATVNPTTTTTYTVTGYNGTCAVPATVTVTVTPVPVAVVVPSTLLNICGGDSLTLIARGGTSYQWSPAIGLSSTTDSVVRAAPAVSTTYQVIATTGQCSDTTTYRVEVTPLPTTQVVAALSTICEGTPTTLTATGAARYEWSPVTGLSATTGATVIATPLATTTYTVTGFNDQCGVPATVTITVTPTTPVSGTIAMPSGIAPLSTGFTATVPNATAWLWNFGDNQTSTLANPTHTYTAAGTYPVTLTATYGVAGCQTPVTAIGTVTVVDPIVYNIITPNGDGLNETFSAAVSNGPVKLRVFNRWGREVYSADNYDQKWAGGDLAAGSYYYHLAATDGRSWKGWVEIVR